VRRHCHSLQRAAAACAGAAARLNVDHLLPNNNILDITYNAKMLTIYKNNS
jgi:hypothetical protein